MAIFTFTTKPITDLGAILRLISGMSYAFNKYAPDCDLVTVPKLVPVVDANSNTFFEIDLEDGCTTTPFVPLQGGENTVTTFYEADTVDVMLGIMLLNDMGLLGSWTWEPNDTAESYGLYGDAAALFKEFTGYKYGCRQES